MPCRPEDHCQQRNGIEKGYRHPNREGNGRGPTKRKDQTGFVAKEFPAQVARCGILAEPGRIEWIKDPEADGEDREADSDDGKTNKCSKRKNFVVAGGAMMMPGWQGSRHRAIHSGLHGRPATRALIMASFLPARADARVPGLPGAKIAYR